MGDLQEIDKKPMGKPTRSSRLQKSPIIFLFYFLLFTYPLLSFIWRRSYPLLSVEVGALFLVVIIVSVLLTLVLTNVRSSVINMLSSLLITILFLVQFNLLLEGAIVCMAVSLVMAVWLKTGPWLTTHSGR